MNEKQFQDFIERFAETLERMQRSTSSVISAQERAARSLKDFESEIDASTRLAEAENEIDEKNAKRRDERARGLEMAEYKGKQALSEFTNALLSSNGGMSKYSKSLDSAGDAVSSLTKGFGPLGFAIGAVVKALSWLGGEILKIGENSINAYDALSKVGAVGGKTAEDIFELGNKIGYASEDFGKLTKIISGSSEKLIALGTSSGDAVDAFGTVAKRDEEMLKKYRLLGFTIEEYNQAQADSIGYLTASGQVIDRNMRKDGNLTKATNEYLDNLIELSAITGESVDKVKAEKEAAISAANVQIELAQRNEKERKLRDESTQLLASSNEADRKRGEELKKQADDMKQGTAAMNDALVYGKQALDPKSFAGLQSIFATGTIVGDDAAKLARSIPNIVEIVEAVKKGTMPPEQLQIELAKGTKNMIDLVGDASKLSNETSDAFNLTTESMEFYTKMQSRLAAAGGDEEKLLAEMLEERKKAAEEKAKGAMLEAEAARLEAERTGQLGTEKFMKDVADSLGVFDKLRQVFEWLNDIMKKFGDYVKDLTTWFSEHWPFKSSGNEGQAGAAPIPAHDAGGMIGNNQLGVVGEIGPELVTGPMQVVGRQQTADILQDAMNDSGRKQFDDLKRFISTSPMLAGGEARTSSGDSRVQKLRIEQQNREIRENQEDQLNYLIGFNEVLLNASDSLKEFSTTIIGAEDQLRSIFGTDDVMVTGQEDQEDPNKDSSGIVDSMISGFKNIFGIGSSKPAKPATPSTPLPPGVSGLLEQIARGEGTSDDQAKSRGFASGYDVSLGYGAFGGPTDKPLSEMSLSEVKEYQRKMLNDPRNKFRSSAAGKYQITLTTLTELQRKLGLGEDTKFDKETQDMLAKELLKRRGAEKFLSGQMSSGQFQQSLSKEWASIASLSGRSYYGQHTGTSSDQIQAALAGLAAPESPTASGAAARTVAAITPDKKAQEAASATPVIIPTTGQAFSTDISALVAVNAEMKDTLSTKLDSMLAKLDESNTIQTKIQKQSA